MQTIKQRIDHTLDVFRQLRRRDVIIGLSDADWDELCAQVIEDHDRTHDDPVLTRNAYDGTPIMHLKDGQTSFVAHDFANEHERKFPLDVLAVVEAA